MAVKKYIADRDTTITDAYRSNLRCRGTGSNMGAADILEVFSIYGQAASGSVERCRTLVKFPIETMVTDRDNGDLPESGSVRYILKMYNAPHGQTLPRNFTLVLAPVSTSWEEGEGLDMDNYTDITHNKTGSNWVLAGSGTSWSTDGGDYHAANRFEHKFVDGTEDVDIDITSLVEQWITGSEIAAGSGSSPNGGANGFKNYGLGVFLTASQETGSTKVSYYTKKFFARSSEFFLKRPSIEARWDSSIKDNRSSFYYSSSLVAGADNLNTLYLYNYVRGQLKDIPKLTGSNNIYVDLYSGSTGPTGPRLSMSPGGGVPDEGQSATGSRRSTGIYSASISITAAATPLTTLFDVWRVGTTKYHTGSITPLTFSASPQNPGSGLYTTSLTNRRPVYNAKEKAARFRVFTRQKNWNPTIYTKATTTVKNETIEDAYFKLFRVVDEHVIIAYGTGSTKHSLMSYDKDGNYFDIDMTMLEPGFSYGLKLMYYINGAYQEQPEIFKFRVEENG